MTALRDARAQERPRTVLYVVILVVLTFLLWSYFAPLNAVVRGMGRVEPRDATQTIQNLEGGIVREILVREGDEVRAGQILARMEETAYRSAFEELSGRADLLEMQIARLLAEGDRTRDRFEVAPDLAARSPEAAAIEAALFAARRAQYLDTARVLDEIRAERQAELDVLSPMSARGAIPETDVIRARQALLAVEQQITEHHTGFEAARVQTLSERQAELAQLRQQLRVRAAQLERVELRAPMDGIVNRVVVQTAGGVVAPGAPILEIIPLDERPIVAGRILPRDIGPVYVGMRANIKLTAFDYRDYGSITGSVTHISADTIIDPDVRDSEPYYEILVELNTQSLTGPEGEVFLRPGMQAEVELDAGQRTVFQYLFHPLLRVSEAFTEPD